MQRGYNKDQSNVHNRQFIKIKCVRNGKGKRKIVSNGAFNNLKTYFKARMFID